MLRSRLDQPIRHRMPDTRISLTHKFEIAGHEGYITVGLYEDGQPGELFITMSKEGSTIGGLMDTVGTLTSIALQYGVPLESLVKKFAYQRFEPSGFTKNPDIRHATSITDYVFRWLACQFIKGYKEATSATRGQTELPLKEIPEMEKKALNRPVSDLARTGEKELIDVITKNSPNEGSLEMGGNGSSHAERVKTALGNIFMDIVCSHSGSDTVMRDGACSRCTGQGTLGTSEISRRTSQSCGNRPTSGYSAGGHRWTWPRRRARGDRASRTRRTGFYTDGQLQTLGGNRNALRLNLGVCQCPSFNRHPRIDSFRDEFAKRKVVAKTGEWRIAGCIRIDQACSRFGSTQD